MMLDLHSRDGSTQANATPTSFTFYNLSIKGKKHSQSLIALIVLRNVICQFT